MTRGDPVANKRPSTPRRVLHAQHKLERRRALLSAAGQVFGEKGYGAANVEDIVKLAGVARGTFYLYFADKEAVFTALVDDFMTRLEGVVVSIDVTPEASVSPMEQLRQNLTRVVELALNEPTWMRLALHEATSQGPDSPRGSTRSTATCTPSSIAASRWVSAWGWCAWVTGG